MATPALPIANTQNKRQTAIFKRYADNWRARLPERTLTLRGSVRLVDVEGLLPAVLGLLMQVACMGRLFEYLQCIR